MTRVKHFLDHLQYQVTIGMPWHQDMGLTYARQMLYLWSSSSSPFALGYFSDRVPLLTWGQLPPTYRHHIVRMTGIYLHASLDC
jgi:hypothetical protein